MVTRHEVGDMRAAELQIHADGCRWRLRRAWDRGESGHVADLVELCWVISECAVRGVHLRAPAPPGQLVLIPRDAAEGT